MAVQAAKEILRADDGTVSSLLGGLVLGTGVVGTLGGGAQQLCLSWTIPVPKIAPKHSSAWKPKLLILAANCLRT